jgi:acyl transferase domain-containing protein
MSSPREEIAIIGLAGRFPGARNIDEFWRNLRDGVESITSFTAEDLAASGIDPAVLAEPGYVNAGAPLEEADAFDAPFFGMLPREAELTDPQHRIFLECAWTALEHAGCDPERYDGLIGVYGGVARNTYLLQNLASRRDLLEAAGAHQSLIATDKDFSPTRVSYKLNLRGPSINVQTACSTSGVAIHLACQALFAGRLRRGARGGARVRVPLKAGYSYEEGGIQSPDGHCRAFDAQARGTILGSGVAMLVLKRPFRRAARRRHDSRADQRHRDQQRRLRENRLHRAKHRRACASHRGSARDRRCHGRRDRLRGSARHWNLPRRSDRKSRHSRKRSARRRLGRPTARSAP